MSNIERTQAERDAEAKAVGFVAADNEVWQAERRGYCKGWDAAVTHSKTIRGAVRALETIVALAEVPEYANITRPRLKRIKDAAQDALDAIGGQ